MDRQHPNAFELTYTGSAPLLKDIMASFPLGSAYHFSFESGSEWIDYLNPDEWVPFDQNRVVLQAIPLTKKPAIVLHRPLNPPRGRTIEKCPRSDRSGPSQDASGPNQDASGPTQAVLGPSQDASGPSQDASGPNQDASGPQCSKTEKDESEKTWTQTFRKQASDIAKVGAQATAQQAKKWTGSLWSAWSTRNETVQVGSYAVSTIKQLAQGGYGQVYLVRDQSQEYAMKQLLIQSKENLDQVHMEIEVYQAVQHAHIMPLLAVSHVQTPRHQVLLLFPLYKQTLYDRIQLALSSTDPWPFGQGDALKLFEKICSGVRALHQKGFAHYDIKVASCAPVTDPM